MEIEYSRLNRCKNEIRLLSLLPRAHEKKRSMLPACQMFHAFLPDKPRYFALSYVWGNPDDKRIILVDNVPVKVTKNLFEAILELQPNDGHRIIWIDSLCINQSNDQEKSWQVNLMKDIYQQAVQVLAWLGPGDNDSNSVMDYLDSFGAKADACGIDHMRGHHLDIWRELICSPRSTVPERDQSEILMLRANNRAQFISRQAIEDLFYSISGWHGQEHLLPFSGIKDFLTRPWWGRVWVLQEITLPEDAVFMCGTKKISRLRLAAAVNAYAAFWLILIQRPLNVDLPLTKYHLDIIKTVFHHRPIVMLSSPRVYRDGGFSLAALLRATCVGSNNIDRHGPHHLESSEPRDKIFALLGIASDREDLSRRNVFPDYAKSCAEVYTSTMVALLQQGHWSLLSLCQFPKLQDDLPSWVPDWSRSATHMLQDVRDDHVTIYPEFSASGAVLDTPRMTAIGESHSTVRLTVTGSIYDEIEAIGSFPSRISSQKVPLLETWSWPQQWLLEMLRLTYHNKHNKARYADFGDCLSAVARTSIGGVGWSSDGDHERVYDSRFTDAVILTRKGLQRVTNTHLKRDLHQFLAREDIRKIIPDKKEVFNRLGSEIIGKSLGRLPFVTRKGHLGLSADYIERGDVIALIKGCQVPFVLRSRADGTYQLVSEAYVDGIMDGEAATTSTFCPLVLV